MLTGLSHRFPSKQEVIQVFSGAVLPIHIWAILAFLREIPGYILRFSFSDILSLGAYAAVFALVESITITLFFAFIAGILPTKLLRSNFVPASCLVIWLTAIWVIPVHFISFIYQTFQFSISNFQIMIFLWIMSYLVLLTLVLKGINASSLIHSRIQQFIGKVSVLAAAYLVGDVISLLIIVYRVISNSLETL